MIADIVAPITGVVWKILVSVGDKVTTEQPVILLESMKMEVPTLSPAAGVIAAILVKTGDPVEEGDTLATMQPLSGR
jgi:biotin carboxyl carrier protein